MADESHSLAEPRPAAPLAPAGLEWEAAPRPDSPWRQFRDAVFHYRRMVVVIVLAAVALGLAIGRLIRPYYAAEGSIILERPTPHLTQIHPESDWASYDADREMQTQLTIMSSRAVAARTIAEMGLEKRDPEIAQALTGIERGLTAKKEHLDAATRQQIASDIFLSKLQLLPDKLSDTVHVRYSSHDAALAAAVVNAVMRNYLDYSFASHVAAGKEIARWLSGRLADARAQIEKDNQTLLTFQRKNAFTPLVAPPGGEESVLLAQLDVANHHLADARAEAILSAAREREFSGDLATLPPDLRTPAMDSALTALDTARHDYDALDSTYQSNFAPVLAARARWAAAQRDAAQLSGQLAQSLRRRHEADLQQQASLGAEVGQLRRAAADDSAVQLRYVELKARSDRDAELYSALSEKINDASLSATVPPANIHVLDAARKPLAPEYPKRGLDLSLAGVIGLAVGLGAALARGRWSGTVLSGATVRSSAPRELAPLGVIPRYQPVAAAQARTLMPAGRDEAAGNGQRLSAPLPIKDTYARMAANLTARLGLPPKALLITSPNPGDGKTLTSCRAAEALADAGWRVLLVDADVRRPACHRFFGIPNTVGLLAAQRGLPAEPVTVALRLDLLPCEREPEAQLQPRPLRELLARWKNRYDYVLFDSPPGNLTGDAVLLGGLADGVTVIARWASTSIPDLLSLCQDLHRARAPLLGSVLNGTDPSAPEFRYARRHRAYYRAAA